MQVRVPIPGCFDRSGSLDLSHGRLLLLHLEEELGHLFYCTRRKGGEYHHAFHQLFDLVSERKHTKALLINLNPRYLNLIASNHNCLSFSLADANADLYSLPLANTHVFPGRVVPDQM